MEFCRARHRRHRAGYGRTAASSDLPAVSWKDIEPLIPIAGSCFVMVVAQSAATARIYAVRHHQRADENADLTGLAAANAAAALSGTFVVNGSPTQTAMVERSGGQSQIAHVAAAVVVSLGAAVPDRPVSIPAPMRAGRHRVHCGHPPYGSARAAELSGGRAPANSGWRSRPPAVVVLVGVEQGIILAMVLSLLRIVHHSYRPHTAVLVQDRRHLATDIRWFRER